MAENTIDNLSIEVTAISDAATKAFDRLAASANRLRGAASGSAGGLREAGDAAKEFGNTTAKAGEISEKVGKDIRGVGKDAKDAGDKAKKGASGLKTFWESLKRIAFYRFVRSVIREITDSFKTGITNLYQWSSAINGHFASAMDRLATSSLYLKNSLGAMASPLIESFVPVLDVIIDRVVDILNFFNMLVSAVSGADTYTIAKKTATVWDDSASNVKKSAKSAADDIKRTILGFDEINKLVKANTSGDNSGSASGNKTPGYSSMFEEKPLTGIFKNISEVTNGWPDWLKALLSAGTAGLAIFGIPALLKAIYDGLKKLFSIGVPNWFSHLFGPRDGKNSGINLPEEIQLPQTELPIEPVLNKTPDKVFDGFKDDWNQNKPTLYMAPKLNNTAQVLYNLFKKAWDKAGSKILYFSPKLDNAATVLYNTFKREWNNAGSKILYFSPKLDNPATVLYNVFKAAWNNAGSKILYFSPKLDNTATVLYNNFKREWENAGSKILYFSPKLDNTANVLYNNFMWDWNAAGSKTLYFSPKLDNRASVLWNNFVREWNNVKYTLSVDVQLNYIGMSSGGVARSFGGGGGSRGGGAGRGRRSIGGVLANGFWQNIPKYAGGTSGAHGTMFIAGEAGPEIVGHIGGRTEVLNKSQIASAMYSAVQAAMAPASANFAAAAYAMNADTTAFDMEMFAEMVRQGVESAMERERDILRQQLDTLRQINDKDTTVEVSTSSVNRAQSRMNRRYGKTIVPVGT